ncbi:MAG: uracil-DNA glycosylase [Chloroflexi bacterium]|nr:uracil-DNA glycosylase [Chloroflexota bacterium]
MSLEQVHQAILTCPDCRLCRSRTRAVPGEGPAQAEMVFIGEGPGWHEDQQGRPFVGPAGHFLEELLASVGLRREQVFITNLVKCRPPGNRDPLPDEAAACQKYLDRQLEVIRPRLVVALGRHALAHFFPKVSISKTHGTALERDGLSYFAMYHPAAALHQGSLRQQIMSDMQNLPLALQGLGEKTQSPAEPETRQMNLF